MIVNKTTGKIISDKEKVCKNIFSQSLGLMFSKRKNLVMEFDKKNKISIHMFFVFYPIDVLILDENKRIVEVKRNFKPFRFWNSKERGKYVVELSFPAEYEVGDKIEIK